MNPLRLVVIIEASTITGPAKNLLEFAKGAAALGVDTQIVTFVRGDEANLFVQAAQRDGLGAHAIREQDRYDRRVIRELQGLAARLQPDIIQTHAVKSHFLVRLARLQRRLPWVAFHHGYTWTSARARMYNQLDRWSLRAAHKVITVSQPFRSELQDKGVPAERIEVIHNAIRLDWASEARQPENADKVRADWKIPPDRKVILIVGRLSLEKDHLTLIRALAQIPAHLQPHLLIVGEGPERSRIEEELRRSGLSAAVTLTGQQTAVERFYGIADLAVLSSRTEGSPNALLEAMAAQVPVVATRVGGIPEIVQDGESALLVSPGDAGQLAGAMTRLFDDPVLARRLVDRAVQSIRTNHAPEARTARLVEIYRSLADKK